MKLRLEVGGLTAVFDGLADPVDFVQAIRLAIALLSTQEWTKVRAIGNLQILTRASYVSLLLVPMIAAAWLPLSSLIFNSIEPVSVILASARAEVADTNSLIALSHVETPYVVNLEARIKELTDGLDQLSKLIPETSQSIHLPILWAILFLSALSVAVAHFIFEIAAPTELKKLSRGEFVRLQIHEFRDSPSEAKVEQAIHTVSNAHSVEPIAIRRALHESGVDNLRFFQIVAPYVKDISTFYLRNLGGLDEVDIYNISENGDLQQKQFVLIEEAAKISYANLAQTRAPWAGLATFFYFIGLVGILAIVVLQTRTVLLACGLI